MKIAPVQNFNCKNSFNQRVASRISFGDIDGDRIIISSKPKEIRILSPQWEILNAQSNILHYQNSNIVELGKKLMQEGYSMEFSTKNIQSYANSLALESLPKLDEALELYEDAKARDFQSYYSYDYACGWSKREIEKVEGGIEITEYDNDDEAEALRRVKITPDRVIYKDIRYVSGLIDEYVFDRNSKQLLALTLGKNEGLFGGYKAEEIYEFDSEGKLYSYARGYKTTKDADETIDEIYYFDEEHIQKYCRNYFNGGEPFKTTASKILYFTEKGCTRADLDFKDTEAKQTISKQYLFDTHGNIDAYVSELAIKQNGITTAPVIYIYKSGIMDKVMTKYEAFNDNKVATAQKVFAYDLNYYHIGSCTLKNRGFVDENYKIENCMGEKIAHFYRSHY